MARRLHEKGPPRSTPTAQLEEHREAGNDPETLSLQDVCKTCDATLDPRSFEAEEAPRPREEGRRRGFRWHLCQGRAARPCGCTNSLSLSFAAGDAGTVPVLTCRGCHEDQESLCPAAQRDSHTLPPGEQFGFRACPPAASRCPHRAGPQGRRLGSGRSHDPPAERLLKQLPFPKADLPPWGL